MRLVPLSLLLAAIYVDLDAIPPFEGPAHEPEPEVYPRTGPDGLAIEGIPFDVLANAYDATGATPFRVSDRESFLSNLVAAIRDHGEAVVGYPPPFVSRRGSIATRADVRAVLDAAIEGYGGPSFARLTESDLDAFLASLASVGFTLPG